MVADQDVRYDFEDNSISFIEFEGTANFGYVKVLIENLDDSSSLVDQQPPGKVYRNFNVWVGDGRFDGEGMTDTVIGFKVSKDWLSANDINLDSVALLHYSNAWQILDTMQTEEDADYFYFEAQADGFSPFAISAVDSTTGTDEISRPDDSGSAEPAVGNSSENTTEPAKTTPGPGVLAVLGIICTIYVMLKRL